MPLLLQQLVKSRRSFFSLTTQPVVIELYDENRFVMFSIDRVTKVRTETLMDVPLTALSVLKVESQLELTAMAVSRRLDFSDGMQYLGLAGGGLIGMAITSAVYQPRGIGVWVEALRARGVNVRTRIVGAPAIILLSSFFVLGAGGMLWAFLAAYFEAKSR